MQSLVLATCEQQDVMSGLRSTWLWSTARGDLVHWSLQSPGLVLSTCPKMATVTGLADGKQAEMGNLLRS